MYKINIKMYNINNITNLLRRAITQTSLFIDTGNRLGTCVKTALFKVGLKQVSMSKVGRNLRLKEALPSYIKEVFNK